MIDRPSGLATQAYHALLRRILSAELRPGQRLREDELMQQLDVGRTPLREAILRLERERLIDIRPRQGTYVTAVTASSIRLVTEVRAPLEAEAAALAARRLDDQTEAGLAEILQRPAGDGPHGRDELMAFDERVHRLIWRAARSAYLEEALAAWFPLALRTGFLVLERVPALESAILSHTDIVAALIAGRSRPAAEAMREHVTAFERQAVALLDPALE